MYRRLTRRRNVIAALMAGSVCFGVAGGFVLGPLWSIAGVVAGPIIAFIAVLIVMLIAVPDAPAVITDNPSEALSRLEIDIRTAGNMAKIWPNQWRGDLANRLAAKSYAQQQLRQHAPALSSVTEAVRIYQDLAAERPEKYAPALADALDHQARLLALADRKEEACAVGETALRLYRNLADRDPSEYLSVLAAALTRMIGWLHGIDNDSDALAAALEATDIYWHKLPPANLPPDAAFAALLEGHLLWRQARYHDATTSLVRSWHVASSHRMTDALTAAEPPLKAAYHADADDFTAVWLSETGAELPEWIST